MDNMNEKKDTEVCAESEIIIETEAPEKKKKILFQGHWIMLPRWERTIPIKTIVEELECCLISMLQTKFVCWNPVLEMPVQ